MKFKDTLKLDTEIRKAMINRNIIMIFYISLFSIISRVLSIFYLRNNLPKDTVVDLWQTKILQLHLVFLALWIGSFFISSYLSFRKQASPRFCFLYNIIFASIIVMGTFASAYDQLISSSMIAFLISNLSGAILIIIHPFIAISAYTLNYILLLLLLPIYQTNPAIIVSIRINALVVVILSTFLSSVLYTYYIRNYKQRRYIEFQKKELEYFANTDPLTNLMNRRHFLNIVENDGTDAILAVVDIDNFKFINDNFGHPIGDQVLQKFAELMRQNFNGQNLIARFGGEEFLILMKDLTLEEASQKLNAFKTMISEKVFNIEGHALHFTISIGFAYKGETLEAFYESYKLADKALYKAKTNGKNAVMQG